MRITPSLDLTYSTNVHPGESWAEVRASLLRYAPELKRRLSPQAPFGIGLRLSAQAANELRSGGNLQALKKWLDENRLYVALINGFPYGQFHGTAVKEQVFAPDWRAAERLSYTLDLIEILKELLPEGMDGGISTMPLAYPKTWRTPGEIDEIDYLRPGSRIMQNLARVVERLAEVEEQTGKWIHLDIEPEPGGLVDTTDNLASLFLSGHADAAIAQLRGISRKQARENLLRYLHVCFDTCHLAVKFEDVSASLKKLRRAGIGVGRVQLSSALRTVIVDTEESRRIATEKLQPFAESTYLHQTVRRLADGRTRQYSDLPVALAAMAPGEQEWRTHYHVPLFVAEYDGLFSTQVDNIAVLRSLRRHAATTHLEIETYTWEVLPAGLKTDLISSIEREYRWVLEQLAR